MVASTSFPSILAFESSCDECAVAYMAPDGALVHRVHSQIALHARYGGVVPELASRDHVRHIGALTQEVLATAGVSLADVGVLAYTAGPGLAGALMVGASFAQSLAWSLHKTILPIHHLEGHLLSPLLTNKADMPDFPFVALLLSGGHSQFYEVRGAGDYTLMGESVDDAVGEAFDKSAKLMGMPYPGGAQLEELARQAKINPDRPQRTLPRPMRDSGDLMMSFSGLKTAVWHWVRDTPPDKIREEYPRIALEFHQAVAEVIVKKALLACRQSGINRLALGGGVTKNTFLREALNKACGENNIKLYATPMEFCTDNAAMIALAARLISEDANLFQQRQQSAGGFAVHPHWPLSSLTEINH